MFFFLLLAILFELPKLELFSTSLKGLSYQESTVAKGRCKK